MKCNYNNSNICVFIKAILINILVLATGLSCHTVEIISFNKDDSKYINKVVILGPQRSKGINVNMTGDANIFYLLMGPAILPQIMLAYSAYAANKEEATYLNDILSDFNMEKILREKFKEAIGAYTYFNPILIDDLSDNQAIKNILDKETKTMGDYIKIASITGADTIAELEALSYGVKDPGLLWDPNVTLKAYARMTRIRDNKTLWQTIAYVDEKRKASGFIYEQYKEEGGRLLRYELEAAAEIVAMTMVKGLGFKIDNDIGDIDEIVSQRMQKELEGQENSPEISESPLLPADLSPLSEASHASFVSKDKKEDLVNDKGTSTSKNDGPNL